MKRVEAERFFISAQFGNVPAGKILNVTDHQAEAFVSHGFVKILKPVVPPESKKSPVKEGQDPVDFTPPAGDQQGPGSSSLAGLASKKRIVRKSAPGAKKAKRKRTQKKPKTSRS